MRIRPTGIPDLDSAEFELIAGAAHGISAVATTDREIGYAAGIEHIALHYGGHVPPNRLYLAFGSFLRLSFALDLVALRAAIVADAARTDADRAYATAVGDMSRWLFGSGMAPALAPFLDAAEAADSDQ